jgi:hypothetical protein
MDGQEVLFEGGPPERAVREVVPPGTVVVPRPPGWILLANKNGPNGFHLVKSVGVLGSVRTVCGLSGRKITESERAIILCPSCEEIGAL